ncbi:MAG TPA: glycosidase [Firmicutes bacterium]|nr:glycosidase [Bacillota bacterium]
MKLKRLTAKPILSPIADHDWERTAVFNCAAIYDDGLFHLFYRATDRPFGDFTVRFVSSIGYAVSEDGIHFTRFEKPIYTGLGPQEDWGVEDPRITKIEDTYYMLYTAFGGRSLDDVRISMASTKKLGPEGSGACPWMWMRHGVVLDEPNKDAALFPEKIQGRYAMLHRRPPGIWIAFSDDLKTWIDHQKIMDVVPGNWDSYKIGAAGPPIKTPGGWLLMYHGVDEKRVYRLGAALLDLKDPTRVLARRPEPILEPELDWEINGLVPNVVFSCGAAETDDAYFVYYGAADTCIGVAAMRKDEVKF